MTDLAQDIAILALCIGSVLHTVAGRRQRRHVEYQQRLIEKLLHDRANQPPGVE